MAGIGRVGGAAVSAGLCHQLVHRTAIQLEMLAGVLLGGLPEGGMLAGVPFLPHLLAGLLNPRVAFGLAAGPVREPGRILPAAVRSTHIVWLEVRLVLADRRWLGVGRARRRREGVAAHLGRLRRLLLQVAIVVVKLLTASLLRGFLHKRRRCS